MKKYIFLVLVALSCSPSVNKQQSKNPANEKPGWLAAKPDVDGFYVGIGHSTKDGLNNYVQEAKKSALEDLVSEIKVNVSSTSTLSQIDTDKQFHEKYEQMIQTTAADEIEEFEQVDTWQDERNYWVYYRLSKARYREIKEQQKRDAVTLALDYFTKAKTAERAGDFIQGLGFYYQGFHAVEKYLAEPITLTFEGKEIILTNEIYASMQTILDKIQLGLTPREITLNRRMMTNSQAFVAKATLKDNGKSMADLPLRAAFEKGAGDVYPDYKTDPNGQAKILISKIGSRDAEQTVGVSVNLNAFAGANATPIYTLVASRMVAPKVSLLMKVQRPLVYVTAIEKSLGATKNTLQITNRIRNYLTNQGFEFTDDKTKAELWLDVSANSEKGAMSGSIYITYVTANIRMLELPAAKEIYSTTLDRIKGYSLDYERSSQEAYNLSLQTLDKEKLPELLNAVLQ